jgi:alanine dehydrogenase
MATKASIGFPRMLLEAGEKRVFLPEFMQFLLDQGTELYLEEGYGSRSGFTFDDYRGGSKLVHSCSREQAFQKDYIILLRSPRLEEFEKLGRGSCLISMLHFPTRPKRVALLKELGARAISMDSIVDDRNLRLVEDMKAVAWNGLETGFDCLEARFPGLDRGDGEPWRTLVIGTGMVGKHAVDAATKLGNVERNNEHIQAGGPGAIASAVGRNVTSNAELMKVLFQGADVLVDAAYRRDSSRPVAPNEWIAWLPEHAVIVDLSVDPYTLDVDPPVVRGVEGIPQGNLDQYIFKPDDPNWCKSIPASIPTANRRTTVTCYSWPGIHPEASMLHYASQLKPLMQALLAVGYDGLSLDGGYFERALYRASLEAW